MADDNIDLRNDDIWDDSALIESWNQALDEYKVRELDLKAHQTSIHLGRDLVVSLTRPFLSTLQKYHSIYAGNSKGLQQSPPPHQPSAASTASAPAPEAAGVPESKMSAHFPLWCPLLQFKHLLGLEQESLF